MLYNSVFSLINCLILIVLIEFAFGNDRNPEMTIPEIDRLDELHIVTDSGKILPQTYTWDPDAWQIKFEMIQILSGITSKACNFKLIYESDKNLTLLYSKNPTKFDQVQKGDFLFYMKKGSNILEDNSITAREYMQLCKPEEVMEIKGISNILLNFKKNLMFKNFINDVLYKNTDIPLFFFSFPFKTLIRKLEEYSDFSKQNTSNQIVTFLTKYLDENPPVISNAILIQDLKENILLQYKDWKQNLKTFCTKFDLIQGNQT